MADVLVNTTETLAVGLLDAPALLTQSWTDGSHESLPMVVRDGTTLLILPAEVLSVGATEAMDRLVRSYFDPQEELVPIGVTEAVTVISITYASETLAPILDESAASDPAGQVGDSLAVGLTDAAGAVSELHFDVSDSAAVGASEGTPSITFDTLHQVAGSDSVGVSGSETASIPLLTVYPGAEPLAMGLSDLTLTDHQLFTVQEALDVGMQDVFFGSTVLTQATETLRVRVTDQVGVPPADTTHVVSDLVGVGLSDLAWVHRRDHGEAWTESLGWSHRYALRPASFAVVERKDW